MVVAFYLKLSCKLSLIPDQEFLDKVIHNRMFRLRLCKNSLLNDMINDSNKREVMNVSFNVKINGLSVQYYMDVQ